MLFSLFFGAGNLIFPPALGQAAGTEIWVAMLGFLVTGVGLPLLGVLSLGLTGSDDAHALASRVHPVFATVLIVATYLTIGPFFAIPRTGAVSYEIAIRPFLVDIPSTLGLGLYTVIFFVITAWLALNPSKIVDRVGKILTPILLLVLTMLVVNAFINPLGDIQSPEESFSNHAFFKGFQEGYLTMDTLASIVFGIIVINAVKARGVTGKKDIAKACSAAGLVATTCLGLIYVALAYLGATSTTVIGKASNGGVILAQVTNLYYGSAGKIILGLAIFFACLTTSIGLVSACASFFEKMLPRFNYRQWVLMVSGFSLVVANVGLDQLINLSIPVLVTIYPMVIVLIGLTFVESLFDKRSEVYRCSMLFTGLVSVVDGLKAAGMSLGTIDTFLLKHLPLFDTSMGWVLPALIGALLGYGISLASDVLAAGDAEAAN